MSGLRRDRVVGTHEAVDDETAATDSVPKVDVGSAWIRQDDDFDQTYLRIQSGAARDPAAIEAHFEGPKLPGKLARAIGAKRRLEFRQRKCGAGRACLIPANQPCRGLGRRY